MEVNKIHFINKDREESEFEIVEIRKFFETRPKKLIESDYRLDFWSMIYITEGKGVHSVDFVEHPYEKGNLIVLTKNQVHSYRVNEDAKGYILNISEKFFIENGEKMDMDMLAFFETPYGEPVLRINTAKNETSRQIIDLIFKEYQMGNSNYRKLIKTLFLSFVYSVRIENLESIKKFSYSKYEHYYKYRSLVEENFRKFKNVNDYEMMMGLSKKTINLACRDCAGISAKEIITNRIILEAKRLIAQGKMKNYEITEDLGFDEPANLACFFKRYTGMTMKEFKEIKDEW